MLLPPRNASHKSLDQHPNKGTEGCKLRSASGLRGPLILSKGSRREGGVRVGWWAPLRTNEVFSPRWWQKERPAQNRAVGQQRSGVGGYICGRSESVTQGLLSSLCPFYSSGTCLPRSPDPLGKLHSHPLIRKVLGT